MQSYIYEVCALNIEQKLLELFECLLEKSVVVKEYLSAKRQFSVIML